MKNNITLSIGIPVLNEEKNISNIIEDIFQQDLRTVSLAEIIVISDASSDSTEQIVGRFKKPEIKLYRNEERIGKALTQNIIARKAAGDLLVLLDADIRIRDKKFLEKLIKPIMNDKLVGITSPKILPIKSDTFIGDVLDYSVRIKNKIYESYDHGNNIYSCHGRARAFSKRLYKKIKWPKISSEDSFSYLYAISNKFKFCLVPATEIYYKSPQNYLDHLSQSRRFFESEKELEMYFPKKKLQKAFKLPFVLTLRTICLYFLFNPIYFLIYLIVLIRVKLNNNEYGVLWVMSQSSKESIELK